MGQISFTKNRIFNTISRLEISEHLKKKLCSEMNVCQQDTGAERTLIGENLNN